MEILQSPLFIILPFIEIFVLFLFSRKIFSLMSHVLDNLLWRTKWSYYILALLFLPGTYIHELSHYIMAKILFVPTFGIDLIPRKEDFGITLGSVKIAKTDFVRRFLVGAAPFIFGTIILVASMHFLISWEWHTKPLAIIFEIFLMFEIGNTMFMSKRDLEGSWKVFLSILCIYVVLYIWGVDFNELFYMITPYIKTFEQVSIYLGIPILIDLVLVLFLSLFV